MFWRIRSGEVKALLKNALRLLDCAIMPMRCVFCGARCLSGEVGCCAPCTADLPWIATACARCAQPVATDLPQGVYCADCQRQAPPMLATVAPLHYSFPIDAAIKALKFRRRLDYVPAFGSILVRAFSTLPQDIDALLPVPLHWRRQATRGLNQATELCQSIKRHAGLALITNVFRVRSTPYQSGLDAAQRQRNLQAAFVVRGRIKSRHVLIVDDVITTGATCRQLTEAVKAAGARQVSVIALARAATIYTGLKV